MMDFDPGWLYLCTSGALTVKKVAAFQLVLSFRGWLDPTVDVAQRDLLAWFDVPDSNYELGAAFEHTDTVRTATVVDQVWRTVKPVAASHKRLFADAERVDLQQAVDVHNHSKVLNAHCQLGAAKECDHRVGSQLW